MVKVWVEHGPSEYQSSMLTTKAQGGPQSRPGIHERTDTNGVH
jgi:hypothetical protein